jgi:hypothetical protein
MEVVRVEARRMMWHITVARPGVGRRLMEAQTVEAVVLPVARATEFRVVGILKRIR